MKIQKKEISHLLEEAEDGGTVGPEEMRKYKSMVDGLGKMLGRKMREHEMLLNKIDKVSQELEEEHLIVETEKVKLEQDEMQLRDMEEMLNEASSK